MQVKMGVLMNNTKSTEKMPQSRRGLRTRTLPKLRSKLAPILIWLLSLLFLLVSVWSSTSNLSSTDKIFVVVSVMLLSLFLMEVAFRLLNAIEEYQHLISRYEGNISVLLKDVFSFSSTMLVIIILAAFTCIFIFMKHNEIPIVLWYNMGPVSVCASSLGALLMCRALCLDTGPLYDSLHIENSKGLDYGSGMAHSFFHGYLKLVIPNTGTREKHLEELMKDYEDSHHVTLESYKLFMLIPKSLYCPPSLQNVFSPSIEESSSLAEKIRTVAGVQNRVYKNSVYKIKNEKGYRVYVAAEYASPLKTFKDVVDYNGEHSKYYKKHKNDIVLQFYLTLQKVLQEHENCTNFCELIFYDDKDENGHFKDVGQVILQRLRKLQKLRS